MNKELKLQAIIDNAIDGIILMNNMGVIESANPMAAKIFEYSQAEMIGRDLKDLMIEPYYLREDENADSYLKKGIQKLSGIRQEISGKKKDGRIFPFLVTVSEITLEGETLYLGIIQDITQQKLKEEFFKQYVSKLEQSNQELKDFTYASSHDLQEPLRKISAFGERLKQKEFDNLSDQGKDYLERMLNATGRMQNLITDLLSFSTITIKAKAFEMVDLNQLLIEVLTDLEVSIEKAKASIEYEQLPKIEAEPTQLRQVFQNLISNAIKFRKDNCPPIIKIYSKTIQTTPDHSGVKENEYIELRFEDNGIGFDEKHLDKIFNIFQRLEGHKYEGTGIGLAICRKIISYHGGYITAKSEPGKGSIFMMKIPVSQTSK